MASILKRLGKIEEIDLKYLPKRETRKGSRMEGISLMLFSIFFCVMPLLILARAISNDEYRPAVFIFSALFIILVDNYLTRIIPFTHAPVKKRELVGT